MTNNEQPNLLFNCSEKNKNESLILSTDLKDPLQKFDSPTFVSSTQLKNRHQDQCSIDNASNSNINSASNIQSSEIFEVIDTLGNYKQNIGEMNKKRFDHIYKSFRIEITLDDWKKMTANRSENKFASPYYSEVLLPKINKFYNHCVPCVLNHYLRKPSKVIKLRDVSRNYYEGYVNIYCGHAHCCNCEVSGKISFYSNDTCVEGVVLLSGNRSHFVQCIKSRPVKGQIKKQLMEDLQFQPPNSVYRKLQSSLESSERVYGAHTYAPSQSVLRNLK